MKLKERLTKTAAAGVVAGTLSVAMLAGQAAPANAVLPLIPAVAGVVGGTATGAAISGWAVAGYAALSAGVVGLAMTIQQDGSVWFEDALKWLEPDPVPLAETEKNDSFDKDPATGQPRTEDDPSYIWRDSRISIENERWAKFQYSGAPRTLNVIEFDLVFNVPTTPYQRVESTWAMDSQCKRLSDGVVYSESQFFKSVTLQSSAGFNKLFVRSGCAAQNSAELVSTRIRSVTEAEKRDTSKFPTAGWQQPYATYVGPGEDLTAKAPGFNYADPGYRATVECVNDAGVKTTLSLDSAYTSEGKVGIPSCSAAGLGDVASSLSIDFMDGAHKVAPAYRTIPQSDTLLECDPAFGNTCKLEIYIDGVPCVVGTVQCAGWVSQHLANPARVKCFYGSREVSISNCGVLEGAYVHGGSPLTKSNTDGNPDTWDDPLKVPGWTPQPGPNGEPAANPAGDPETIPNPNTTPYPTHPGPEPDPDPAPDPAPEPVPATPPVTGVNPETTEGEDGQNCLAHGWSWNPVSWVMVPVQCALQWAFVPPKSRIDAAVDTVIPKMEIRGIQPFVFPVLESLTGLGGAGCQGPAIDLSAIRLDRVIYPFSACEQPMSHIAVGVNSFFALSIVLQGGMSIIRAVAAAFGFNWGLGSSKVSDGS